MPDPRRDHSLRRFALGTILTITALLLSAAVVVISTASLEWTTVALVLLTAGTIIVVITSLPPTILRPFQLHGSPWIDTHAQAAEIERRTTPLGRGERSRWRHLWGLVPLGLAMAVVRIIASLT